MGEAKNLQQRVTGLIHDIKRIFHNTFFTSLQKFACNIIQLLPLCEGNVAICSPEAGNIARGQSPSAILPVKGEQFVLLYRYKY